ncbi:1-(5-phosphoribosyl)-5-((5-phosphoribosylamino)methylideneamino) imidazole-4-carboxamide isomerase [Acidobacteriia bacterium SbA2]|nr:1-(5-phosphoribosyl)-5-((5-phosphoribosylamino)methylideneamino) imidazole-4-carboxamide isomerase [Acidobacteriia bacterium SbA2]
MIIPCIDLMGGKVVQLIQGREKFLELPDALAVLAKFADYPQIQVIDLDGALGRGDHSEIIRELCRRKPCRVGGGIRTVEKALDVVEGGALKVIVGSSAFASDGINTVFLESLVAAVPREKLMIAVDCLGDRVAIRGWRETLPLTSAQALARLEPYCSEFLCTYIDAEGKLQGTNLAWFRSLRAATQLPITAAGGITTEAEIKALEEIGMNAALGMAIYRKVFPQLFT